MKILIAADGSEFSKAAVDEVCRLGVDQEKTEIIVVAVYTVPIIAAPAPYVAAEYSPMVEKEMRETAENAANEAEVRLRSCFPDLGNRLTTSILSGSADRAIVEEAENVGADLIVVGSHGYGFWSRVFLGSVSASVVNHAPCSVLVVRKRGISSKTKAEK